MALDSELVKVKTFVQPLPMCQYGTNKLVSFTLIFNLLLLYLKYGLCSCADTDVRVATSWDR